MHSTTLDMTKGSPWKLIAGFALPVLLSQIFQQLYNTADTLIVGRYLGDEALAAVSSSGPLIFLLISFFEGLTMGASVTISRYFGAGDHDRVQRAIHTNILVSTCSGIFLTGFGIIMTPQILRWMGTDPEVLPDAISYFRYYFTGVLAVVLYNACKSTTDMELKSVKKKFKDKKFAAGCSRDVITRGAEQLGWELDTLIERTLAAMQATEADVTAKTAALE